MVMQPGLLGLRGHKPRRGKTKATRLSVVNELDLSRGWCPPRLQARFVQPLWKSLLRLRRRLHRLLIVDIPAAAAAAAFKNKRENRKEHSRV